MPTLWRGVSWLLLLLCRVPEAPHDRRLDGGLSLGLVFAPQWIPPGVAVALTRSDRLTFTLVRVCDGSYASHDQELSEVVGGI